MIGRLKGVVEYREGETLQLDVGGVVYELTCPVSTIESVVVGERSVIEVHTHLREDQLSLFGFASKLEKELFYALLSVNGVGPKMAIKILSGAAIQHIARSIESGDVKALSQLPKVGKKTAEQLIVSLKGKLTAFIEPMTASVGVQAAQPMPLAAQLPKAGTRDAIKIEIGSALLNLGFRPQEVERMVEQMPADEK